MKWNDWHFGLLTSNDNIIMNIFWKVSVEGDDFILFFIFMAERFFKVSAEETCFQK